MVHTGKPSPGCQTCRKRRIKCDETSPDCSYCVKKNQPCPGYPDQFDLAWRDQTTVAEKSVLRRERATEKSRQAIMPPRRAQVSIPLPLREYQLDHALCFFFTGYVLITREPEASRGYLEYLTPVYTEVKSQSPLKYATSAVATCLLESRLNRGTGTLLSTSFYLNAISALRQKVEQQDSYSVEELLLAIMLLDLYEGLISVVSSGRQTGMHAAGAVAVIKHRKVNTFQSQTSQGLLLAVRSRLIDNALKTSQSLPQDVESWADIVQGVPQTAAMRLDSISIDVAKLQAMTTKVLQPIELVHAESNMKLEKVMKFAIETDSRLVVWSNSLPPSWNPLRISDLGAIPKSIHTSGLYQSQCDIYNNILTAFTWNTYCCSWLRVQSIMKDFLARLPAEECHLEQPTGNDSDISISNTQALIQSLVDDICYSVPFHLGDRNMPSLLDKLSIQFPNSDTLRYPNDHYRAAGALGGWFLLGSLYNCLAPNLPLRQGQREWIGGQILRVMRICHLDRPT